MNKKAQKVFVGIMIAIMLFVALVVLIEPLKDVIVIGRDADHLNCTNPSITVGQQATCILVDMWLFYFVGVGMAVGIAYITGAKLRKD